MGYLKPRSFWTLHQRPIYPSTCQVLIPISPAIQQPLVDHLLESNGISGTRYAGLVDKQTSTTLRARRHFPLSNLMFNKHTFLILIITKQAVTYFIIPSKTQIQHFLLLDRFYPS